MKNRKILSLKMLQNGDCCVIIRLPRFANKFINKQNRCYGDNCSCDVINSQIERNKYYEPLNERKIEKVMCKAAEVGKIVVNKCIDRNLFINTQKLQKLLVLMQVECIKTSQKPLFKEDVRVWDCGVAITEVNSEFESFGEGFTNKIEEFITLLEAEEKSVDFILDKYGHLDAFELNALPDNQKVIQLGVKTDSSTALHISYQILMGAFL